MPDDNDDGFIWIGHHPGLDLCNTAPQVEARRIELLPDGRALRAWAAAAGVPTPSGRWVPEQATVTWTYALRAALRDLLDPMAAADSGRRDSKPALDALDDVLRPVAGALAVERSDPPRLGLRADDPGTQFRLDLAVATLDALSLDATRVRRCASAACVLLFHDTSRSGRRQWCDMATCGNRAKAAAHYARTRHPQR